MMLQRQTQCTLLAFSVCLGFLANLHAEEPRYLRGNEVTSQLDLESSPLRRSIRNGEYTFDLTVTNQSSKDFAGPLVLVIEKTGVESLLPKRFDQQFADDGQGFHYLVKDNQTLKAGESLKLRRLRLESEPDADFETDPAEAFSLVSHVYQLASDDRIVAEVHGTSSTTNQQKGGPIGIPYRRPDPTGGANDNEPVERLKPVPDPIGESPEEQVAEAGLDPVEEPGEQPRDRRRPRLPSEEELKSALTAKNAWTEKLFDIEGVHTVGRGWGKDGSAVVSVKVEKFAQKKNIPSQLDGVPVEVYVFPQPEFFDRRGQIGFWREPGLCEDGDPKEIFDRPIRIGVSGWNSNHLICATGTIGCRLKNPSIPSETFMLSNSHVFADRGLGSAAIDDPIIQPGYLDFGCAFPPMGVVGLLSNWSTYNLTGNNTIDAAVATTSPLFVGVATPCNGYGVPSETTVVATIGMEVMKYGRTTRFTTGTVLTDSVDSNVFDGANLVAFINQVEIVPDVDFPVFSAGGDSGSLIVARNGHNPVALLFAGSIFSTLGNPIDAVLTGMGGLQVDGQP